MYLLYLHAVFMLAAVGFMLAGIKIAMSFRRTRWWFKIHRRVGFTGVAAMAVGFIFAVLMVSFSHSQHFGSPHTWLGVLTFLSAILTLASGFSVFLFPVRAATLRRVHRWLGRFTAVAAIITVLFGLFLVIL